jgi:hypothetical protein
MNGYFLRLNVFVRPTNGARRTAEKASIELAVRMAERILPFIGQGRLFVGPDEPVTDLLFLGRGSGDTVAVPEWHRH